MASLIAESIRRARLTRQRGKVLKSFSRKLGLVYFGAVDQHQDDHDIVRGMTVSTTHTDKHFAVGAYEGRDLAIVDRADTMQLAEGERHYHAWTILQLNLGTAKELPHLFFSPRHREMHFDHYFHAQRQLTDVSSSFQPNTEFVQRYQLYLSPQLMPDAEGILSDSILSGLSVRFWPHAIEIIDGKLIVYLTEHRLDETVLGAAVQSALWLADALQRDI
ncbi:hypothetical protein CMN23_02065 [Candidatus Saccharibacteria bacterium]|nr:hypothetical protein [Candidatus Saccharibacteria bacterium]MBJ58827.1 hypothetical protein [Candidatus Saccharibacteria bacterium]